MVETAERLGDPGELARADLGRRRRRAARGAVVVAAAGREPGGAGLERGAQQVAHRGDVVGGRDLVGDRAIAHHVHAQRVVRHLDQEVDRVRHRARSTSMYSANDSQPHGIPSASAEPGDVLDALDQLDERGLATRTHRREADAAAAHHAGRHSVQRASATAPRPTRPGRRSGCGDRRSRAGHGRRARRCVRRAGPERAADADDPAVLHRDVAGERRAARAVDEGATSDHEIEHVLLLHCKIVPIKACFAHGGRDEKGGHEPRCIDRRSRDRARSRLGRRGRLWHPRHRRAADRDGRGHLPAARDKKVEPRILDHTLHHALLVCSSHPAKMLTKQVMALKF